MVQRKSLLKGTGVLLALLALTQSCGDEADTVLHVFVDGQVAGDQLIYRFNVDVEVDGERRSFAVPPEAQPLALPKDFTVQVPADLFGRATVDVVAVNMDGQSIGRGVAILPTLDAGAVNRVTITLSPTQADDAGPMPRPDAGSPMDARPPGMDGAGGAAMDMDAASPDAAGAPDAPAPMPMDAAPAMPDAGPALDAAEPDAEEAADAEEDAS